MNGHAQTLERPIARSLAGLKVVVLADELTHLAKEGGQRPKALVDLGGRPLLWHLLSRCSAYGINDFLVALGPKGDLVKRYLLDYGRLAGDLRGDLADGSVERRSDIVCNWRLDLVDSGADASTGERLLSLRSHLRSGAFLLASVDCLCDLDFEALFAFHHARGRLATVAIARPPARFGRLEMRGDQVVDFAEKPQQEEGWVSAGFCVLEPAALDYLARDDAGWEQELLERLAADGQLAAYKHESFWQRMETLRDKKLLEGLWQSGGAPWKTWEEKQA